MDEYINGINENKKAIYELLCKNADKINSNEKIKRIVSIVLMLIPYMEGVTDLVSNNIYRPKCNSIIPICRTFLEGYSIFVGFCENYYDTLEFQKYLRGIIINDMNQDKKIYNLLKKDDKLDKTKLKDVLETYHIAWLKNINEYFPNETKNIDESNVEKSLIDIIKNLYKDNELKDISPRIARALNESCVFDEYGNSYDESSIVYGSLCRETHFNISAIDETTVQNGYFVMQSELTRQKITVCLFYIANCSKEIIKRLEEIFKVTE